MIIHYLQLPFHVDIARLQAEVTALLHRNWQAHFNTRHYDGEWTTLPLRSPGGDPENQFVELMGQPDFADTPLLQHSPYLKEVIHGLPGPALAARLLKLNAGAYIKPHRDYELCFEQGEVRLHIPVYTHPAVAFFVKGERIQMQAGECWYTNVNLIHEVQNPGPTDRIHLVVDIQVNDTVTALFLGNEVLHKRTGPAHDAETTANIITSLRQMNTPTSHALADKIEQEATG
jgi:Aspartyl/Asparaginyl beta-hydroxylase